ncbi:MAG: response regulator [Cyclobacteriaceae bacterium]
MDNKKILVIEYNYEMRDNICELLELSNYRTFEADNGKAGVKTAISEIPDLIICDIMMPGLDGYEVLYMLSKNPETASIPFIFLSAKSEKEDFRKGMELGADDYLTKPFEEIDLLSAIERRLKKHEKLIKERKSGLEPFMANASAASALTEDRKTRTYGKKDNIYREGDFPHYLFQVQSGQVKTFKINSEGKEFIHDIKKPGDFLGQHALIADTNYTEFAEALEDTELLLVPRIDFQTMIFSNREVSAEFIKLLAREVTEKESEMLHLAYDTVRKRTADSLVSLMEKQKSQEINISREDLSNMVGTATESVIRILSEFKKDGIITIKSGLITIIKPDQLNSIMY